jgi:N-acetylmuramoyl-L-alanine amidase
MVRFFTSLALAVIFFTVNAQNTSYLKERADSNALIVLKGKHNLFPVKTNNKELNIHDRTGKIIHTIHWSQVPKFIEIVETCDYYKLVETFKQKGTSAFVQYEAPPQFKHYRSYPKSFDGLFVAIDPGHFGGNEEEAYFERRLVTVEGKYLPGGKDKQFYESELTYTTALLLKDSLERLGATVLLTRDHLGGAMGKSFQVWLRTDFKKDVKTAYEKGDITSTYRDILYQNYKADTVNFKIRGELFEFYKFLDFRARIKKINDFKPNVTLVIHFNASETGKFYGDKRYSELTKTNYSMAFIPGAILNTELEKPDQKIDLIRLLISPDLDNSARLAHLILEGHRKYFNIEPIPYDSLVRMKNVVNQTKYPGVFARNLPLTRMVRGTVFYGESFYQDNIEMAKKLSQESLIITDPKGNKIKTSSLVKEVSGAYMYGLRKWLNENEEFTLQNSARSN